MSDPRIPTEADFLATPDKKEEYEADPAWTKWNLAEVAFPTEPRKEPISSPRDFVDEAVADGLVKDGDTRSVFERTYVPVSQRPERAKEWVDAMARELGNMCFSEEISSWEHRHDARLTDLHKYFPEEYQRILEAIHDAQEKVSTLRW